MDGGGKGIFFEKLVIHYFTPGDHNDYEVNFFNEFEINNVYKVQKFIPKKNEKIALNCNKLKIEYKPFLLKQKNFGGKGLDIVIVELYDENQAVFYCFQITKYKKKKDLFTTSKLKKNLERMAIYMKNFFNFEISTIYFGYIFDYNRINEKKVKNMCKICEEENIKYIFYNYNNCNFYDKNSNTIHIKKDLNELKLNNNPKIKSERFILTNEQKEEIKNILRKIYKINYNLYYYYKTNYLDLMRLKNKKFFCLTQYSFQEKNKKPNPEILMFYYDNNAYNCILLEKKGGIKKLDGNINSLVLFKSEYDYYIIKED